MSNVILMVLRRLRTPLIILIIVYAIAAVGMTLIPGIDDQGNPWRMSFFHAFYFVSFMGTTIGFGEIPYEFTDAQRFWVLFCIYTSVIAWLYGIGTMLSLIQDPAFRQAVTNQTFERSIRRIDRPFYIICGYGETGYLLNHGLAELGIQTVIIDNNNERTNNLELEDLSLRSIALNADITKPESLLAAGMNHHFCRGVIALTGNDHTNLQVAVSCKLLNQAIPVYCRSEIEDEAQNMASFGTDVIVDPFQIFAKKLALLVNNHKLHRIQNWLTNQHSPEHIANRSLPKGKWVICGYGRFGKAIMQQFKDSDIDMLVIDQNPALNQAPGNAITGRGTEASTLLEAGIKDAAVIVAASNDDANNLSILITAHQLNADIFTIGRVNKESNNALFVQANCDYIMRRSQIVANHMLTNISRPLVSNFVQYSSSLNHSDTEQLIDQITDITHGKPPSTWRLIIDEAHAPAIHQYLNNGHIINIGHLCDNHKNSKINNKPCIPLLLKRVGVCHLLPNNDIELNIGDQLLLCSQLTGHILPQYLKDNAELLDSILNNNQHFIPLLRWLHRRKTHLNKAQ